MVFGELFKIYTWVLKAVVITFRSNVSIATKTLHAPMHAGRVVFIYTTPPLCTLIFTVYIGASDAQQNHNDKNYHDIVQNG